LQLLRAGLSGLADTDLLDLSDEQVRSALPQLLRAVNQLAAATAAVVGTLDGPGADRGKMNHGVLRSTATCRTARARTTPEAQARVDQARGSAARRRGHGAGVGANT